MAIPAQPVDVGHPNDLEKRDDEQGHVSTEGVKQDEDVIARPMCKHHGESQTWPAQDPFE